MAASTDDILASVFGDSDFTGTFDPLKMIIWAGVEDIIKGTRMSGLLQLGRTIAGALPGETLDDKLKSFELGAGNRVEMPGSGGRGRLVLLKRDAFGAVDCCTMPWSRQTLSLVRRYNEEMPRAGGALHPLHIVQHEMHRRLGDVVDVGARDVVTGRISLSATGLERSGLSEAEATRLLEGGAMLYVIFD